MPWKTADVDAHVKGLTDPQKKVWVKVANTALARCEEKGGKNCDASAIRQANAVAKEVAEAVTDLVLVDMEGQVLLAESLRSPYSCRAAKVSQELEDAWESRSANIRIALGELGWSSDMRPPHLLVLDTEGQCLLSEYTRDATSDVPVGEAAKLLERLVGASGMAQADIVGTLIRAGYDPAETLTALGLPPIKHLGLPPVTVQSVGGAKPAFGQASEALHEAITGEDKSALAAELKGWSTQDVTSMHRRLHQWASQGNTLTGFSKADMTWYHNASAKELSKRAEKDGGETTHDSPLSYSEAEEGKEVTAEDLEDCKSGVLSRIAKRIKKALGGSAAVDLDSDLIPLAERSVRADGTAPIKIIAPGWGSSGYYPADVLERDGPKVFAAGTQMFIDHPTSTEESERPERSLRDLAGRLISGARWDEGGKAGAGLYAEAEVFQPWQPVIEELAPHIGVSIRALGKTEKGEAEGKSGPIVQELVAVKSVDYVTAPGAGGKVLQLIESTRNRIVSEGRKEEDKDMEQLQEVEKARDEALARVKELETAAEESGTELKRLREVILLREAADVAGEALARTELPEITRARLAEALAKNPPLKEGALDKEVFTTAIDEAVKAEVAYLAEVKGSGRIKGMGSNGSGAEDRKTLEESWKHMHPDWTDDQIRIAVDGR